MNEHEVRNARKAVVALLNKRGLFRDDVIRVCGSVVSNTLASYTKESALFGFYTFTSIMGKCLSHDLEQEVRYNNDKENPNSLSH